MPEEKSKRTYTRIKDRSYEAYVEFITNTFKGLTGREVTTYDEKEMRKRWKQFWAKGDAVDGE